MSTPDVSINLLGRRGRCQRAPFHRRYWRTGHQKIFPPPYTISFHRVSRKFLSRHGLIWRVLSRLTRDGKALRSWHLTCREIREHTFNPARRPSLLHLFAAEMMHGTFNKFGARQLNLELKAVRLSRRNDSGHAGTRRRSDRHHASRRSRPHWRCWAPAACLAVKTQKKKSLRDFLKAW